MFSLESVGVDAGRCSVVLDPVLAKKCLQVSCLEGKVGPKDGGVAWRLGLGRCFDEVWLQYKVYFPENFDFVLGGKLPGVGGGSLPTGGVSDSDGFTARIMWRGEDDGTKGRVVQYVYYPDKQADTWGEDMPWIAGDEPVFFVRGTWHVVKTHIRMNTPGKKDGRLQSWLDGWLVLDRSILFRRDALFGVDTFIFAAFFGGNTADWAPNKDERILFDDFIISTVDI